ncbi:uncharacterized protein LOC113295389 [Papaver somniferum]|uniref:uncharacterized protein LOC113295389 n=1 Tax=Papaver somniferum TaxID=3469 RepID=UPI000E6FFFE1|nr:uncharacterized protein LOC113295389 [Papaver somniferum]
MEGNPTFVYMSKMKRLKTDLKEWNWSVFGDVNKKLKQLEDEIMEATSLSDNNPSDTSLLNNLITARGKQEMRLRQAQNMITELEKYSGVIITEQKEIASELVNHSEEKFKYKDVNIDESILANIPKVITIEDNAIPSDEEIKVAVFDLNPENAPGPGGFAGWFYRSWEIIGAELTRAIQFCWSKGFISNGLNENFLKLLPKVNNAKKAKQFRPIGLMNFSFKIFTKIWATRLEKIINKVVSPQQGAFIKGRTIQEQIALASEMINEIEIKGKEATLVSNWILLKHMILLAGDSYFKS